MIANGLYDFRKGFVRAKHSSTLLWRDPNRNRGGWGYGRGQPAKKTKGVGGVMAVSPCRMMGNQIDLTTLLFGMPNGMPK